MSKSLVKTALRAKDKVGFFKPAKALGDLFEQNGIGAWRGPQVRLREVDVRALDTLLQVEFGVPPGTKPDAWDGLSRAEASEIGTNEKLTSRSVRGSRVAIKAFGDNPLLYDGCKLPLPAGSSLDVDGECVSCLDAYSHVLLVENWEAFESIHRLSFDLTDTAQKALVVYRGDKGAYPISAAKKLLEDLEKPVIVFSDIDPSGLMIAASTPDFDSLAWPSLEHVEKMLASGRGDRDRFMLQRPRVEAFLDSCQQPQITSFWNLLRKYGRAIPQEEFIRPV